MPVSFHHRLFPSLRRQQRVCPHPFPFLLPNLAGDLKNHTHAAGMSLAAVNRLFPVGRVGVPGLSYICTVKCFE